MLAKLAFDNAFVSSSVNNNHLHIPEYICELLGCLHLHRVTLALVPGCLFCGCDTPVSGTKVRQLVGVVCC